VDERTEAQAPVRSTVRSAPAQRPSSGSGAGLGFTLFGLLCLAGPFVAAGLGLSIPPGSQLLLAIFGLALVVIGGAITTITRLYHRAPADRAFVKTGMGGARAVLDGGAIIIPVVHEVIWVSLRTMTLEVVRKDKDSLITKDSLRADITAEFFIKVPKDEQSVLKAATSLGAAAIDPDLVKEILQQKLVSALRQVAAELEFKDLLSNRALFIEKVMSHVKQDIQPNGLELESVTISMLDQTRTSVLDPEHNVIDAEGVRKTTEITAAQSVLRTQYQLSAERKIREEQVSTQRFLAEQSVAEASAQAERDRQIQVVQATAQQEAATAAAEQARLARIAEVNRDREVELARVAQAQAVAVANQARERADREAEIAKNQAVEVADRQRQIAVANREAELAAARAAQLEAQAESERAAQQITTVQVEATAQRNKTQAVIDAEAAAEKQKLSEFIKVDVAAYGTVQAAEAEQKAARLTAEARLVQARAAQEARGLEAQGEQAIQMVPVQVEKERVSVEAARVDVQRTDLANKQEFQAIARELQVELARIEADKEVEVARARAMGEAFAKANVTVWGDPATVARMSEAFYRGHSASQLANGLAAGATPEVRDAALSIGSVLARILRERLGIEVDPAAAETAFVNLTREAGAAPAPPGGSSNGPRGESAR
jgi:flotillin